jgi:hypothetical protein
MQADIDAIKKALGINTPAPASVLRLSEIARSMLMPKKSRRLKKVERQSD